MTSDTKYTTHLTKVKDIYYCRVDYDGRPIVQTKVRSRTEISAAFRDLLRTLDKLGGDAFTNAARYRKWKEGNLDLNVKHEWLTK